MKQKNCRYCWTSFIPNPRVGKRQKTWGKPACKKALKAENNARWRKENPDYCRQDYLPLTRSILKTLCRKMASNFFRSRGGATRNIPLPYKHPPVTKT